MTKDHNNNGAGCGYSVDLVTLLYDDAAGDSGLFEHVTHCRSCSVELEGLSFARRAVSEWQAAEFSGLNTPVFELPYDSGLSVRAVASPMAGNSMIDRLLSLSRGWAVGFAAAAFVILAAAAVVLYMQSTGPADVAEVPVTPAVEESIAGTDTVQRAVAPERDPEPQISTAEEIALEKRSVASKPADTRSVSKKPVRVKNSVTKRAAIAVRQHPEKKTDVTPQLVPRLDDFEEAEDDSLRLADLFAQTGSE